MARFLSLMPLVFFVAACSSGSDSGGAGVDGKLPSPRALGTELVVASGVFTENGQAPTPYHCTESTPLDPRLQDGQTFTFVDRWTIAAGETSGMDAGTLEILGKDGSKVKSRFTVNSDFSFWFIQECEYGDSSISCLGLELSPALERALGDRPNDEDESSVARSCTVAPDSDEKRVVTHGTYRLADGKRTVQATRIETSTTGKIFCQGSTDEFTARGTGERRTVEIVTSEIPNFRLPLCNSSMTKVFKAEIIRDEQGRMFTNEHFEIRNLNF